MSPASRSASPRANNSLIAVAERRLPAAGATTEAAEGPEPATGSDTAGGAPVESPEPVTGSADGVAAESRGPAAGSASAGRVLTPRSAKFVGRGASLEGATATS